MERLGVIKKIEEPTEQCAGLVVVPKQSGKVRTCVDLTKLNENVCREISITSSRASIGPALRGHCFFYFRCQFRFLANSVIGGICSFNNINFPIWEILLLSNAIQNNFSAQAFSTMNFLYFEWVYWGRLFNG